MLYCVLEGNGKDFASTAAVHEYYGYDFMILFGML
jgi:hypothetical protein